jgi:hypothetical protein
MTAADELTCPACGDLVPPGTVMCLGEDNARPGTGNRHFAIDPDDDVESGLHDPQCVEGGGCLACKCPGWSR